MKGESYRAGAIAALTVLLFGACGAPGVRAAGGLIQWAIPKAGAAGPANEKAVIIVVPGHLPWTDTGIDVSAGEEILFAARGQISLQKGNPESECGPEGCDIQTARQPLPGKNLGSLIGKVVIAVIETVDEKTKLERRDEIGEIFFLGSGGRVEMPARGRLFLGINDNVIGDNAGEFTVTIEYAGKDFRSD